MVVMNRKNLRSLAAGVALLLAVGALAGCGGEKKADDSKKMVTVGIAQLVEHGALDAANKGFVAGMASKGFKENENVKYDRQNAQADQSNLQNIAQRFVSNKVDLICAIATPTAQTMANATKDIPIVATAVTDYEVAKLAASNNEPKGNVTGTSDMNPIDQQLELLLKIAPQTKNIVKQNSFFMGFQKMFHVKHFLNDIFFLFYRKFRFYNSIKETHVYRTYVR